MKLYSVRFTGQINVHAETEEEARENFYANILEVFEESNISDVKISEEPET